MAISYVGSATGTTSATLPTFSVGDFALVFAYRDGSTTAPSLPAGWTSALTGGGNTASARTGYRVLQSGDTTTGTWTNSTSVVCLVYRAGSGEIISIGASNQTGAASTSINYASLTLNGNGKSWVVGFAGHRSVNTSLETPPTGWSNRASVVDATDEAAGHDTGGPVSSWAGETVSVGGTSSGHRDHVLELSLLSPDDNLLLFPEAFDNAAWATFSAPTVTADVANDPNGNPTADQLALGQAARQHTGPLAAGSYYLSVMVKAAPTGSATHVRATTNNTLAWNTGGSTKIALTSAWQELGVVHSNAANGAIALIIGAVDAAGAADPQISGNVLVAWAMLNIGSSRGTYTPIDPPAGGAPVTLAAAASAQAAASAALAKQAALAGAATAQAAATAALAKAATLAAAATAQATAQATLLHGVSLAAAGLSVASGGAALTHSVPLAASAQAVAAASGQIAITVTLGAAALAQALASAALSTGKPLGAVAQGQAAASAGLAVDKPLGAVAQAQAASGATLSLSVALSAAALAQAAASAALQVDAGGAQKDLQAAATAQASASGLLSLSVPLAADALATAAASGSLQLTISVAGSALAQSGASAALQVDPFVPVVIELAAAGVAVGTATAALAVFGLQGAVAGAMVPRRALGTTARPAAAHDGDRIQGAAASKRPAHLFTHRPASAMRLGARPTR